jgi:hypothetical protein
MSSWRAQTQSKQTRSRWRQCFPLKGLYQRVSPHGVEIQNTNMTTCKNLSFIPWMALLRTVTLLRDSTGLWQFRSPTTHTWCPGRRTVEWDCWDKPVITWGTCCNLLAASTRSERTPLDPYCLVRIHRGSWQTWSNQEWRQLSRMTNTRNHLHQTVVY